jgi:AraC-like DNA-binding protein
METSNMKISTALKLKLLIISAGEADRPAFNALNETYDLMYCDNIHDGLSISREYIPALVIINPFMNQNEFRMQLKKNFRTSRIPILAIIAKHDMHGQSLSCVAEWDDFIQSPFAELELKLRVRIMLINRDRFQERYVNFQPGPLAVCREGFLKRIKGIIEHNLDNNLFGVRELAREAGVSQPQLYRKLVALAGFSPNSYIRHIRMKQAAYLLAQGDGNVSEIAYRVGFSSHSYFTKCFKAAHHYNPKQVLR